MVKNVKYVREYNYYWMIKMMKLISREKGDLDKYIYLLYMFYLRKMRVNNNKVFLLLLLFGGYLLGFWKA